MNRGFSFILFSCLALVIFTIYFVNAQNWEQYTDPNQVTPPSTTSSSPDSSVANTVANTVAEQVATGLHGCKLIAELNSVPNKYVATSVDISGFPNFQHFLLVGKEDGLVKISSVFDFFQNDLLGSPGAWRANVEKIGSFGIAKDKTNKLLPGKDSPSSQIAIEVVTIEGVNGNGKSEYLSRFQLGPGYPTDPIVGVTDDSTATHEIYAESGRLAENGPTNLIMYIDSYVKTSYQPLGWKFDGFGLHPDGFKKKKGKSSPIGSNKTVQLYTC